MTKKLLFLVNEGTFFLLHRGALARAAKEAGYEVHVATPRDAQAEAKYAENGFTYHPIPLSRKGANPLGELKTLLAIRALYKQVRPDITHHVTIKPVIYGGIAARLAGVPATVSAISGLGYVFIQQTLKARVLRSIATFLYKRALGHKNARVIFQNPDDRAAFERNRLVRPAQIRMIRGSGVDLEKFSVAERPATPPVRITLIARMLWDKGVGEFVEAARMLKDTGAEFCLVGDTDDGNPAAIPSATLKGWAEEGIVQWQGWAEDINAIYANSHIACLPSYREGMPKALIEACACGLPIVTADVPGCRETVQEGVNGFMVPVRTSEPLAAALKKLIEDENMRTQFGAASRALAESEFSLKKVIAQHLEIYKELSE